MISAYSSIAALGHPSLDRLFDGAVLVQEKVDGSQFSFRRNLDSTLSFRSKNQEVFPGAAGMFEAAVSAVLARAENLHPDWTYRGEYLSKPKHNVLAYARVPDGHVVVFDIATGPESYLSPVLAEAETARIGFEHIPRFDIVYATPTMDDLHAWLNRTSFLGGQKVEGVVFKNYTQFGADHKVLMGKYVSEKFKEVHAGEWRKMNPVAGDIIQQLVLAYKTPARWEKAVQHMRDDGLLTQSPKDIGPLLGAVVKDVHTEEADAIRDALFKYAWPRIARGLTAGFAEWYKEQLAEEALR